MLYLIPARVHRWALRNAHRIRSRFRRAFKPDIAGVSVILRDGEGRVLLVRHSYGPRGWSGVGGGLKRGEEPEAALRREVREELSCDIEAVELAATLHEMLSGAPHTAYVFTARPVGEVQVDGRELVEARWFTPEELPQAPLTRTCRSRLVRLGLLEQR